MLVARLDKFLLESAGRTPQKFHRLLAAVTWLGSMVVVSLLGLITAYSRWTDHSLAWSLRRSAALMIVLLPVASIIKIVTRRKRPDTLYVQKMRFAHYSFPSGHAYGSLLVYGFLACLAASWPIYILAALLVFLIGLSRVYLGAHFPSDVLGGWLLAAVALVIVITI